MMNDIKPDKFKTNAFAKKYKHTLAMRAEKRSSREKALDSKK